MNKGKKAKIIRMETRSEEVKGWAGPPLRLWGGGNWFARFVHLGHVLYMHSAVVVDR